MQRQYPPQKQYPLWQVEHCEAAMPLQVTQVLSQGWQTTPMPMQPVVGQVAMQYPPVLLVSRKLEPGQERQEKLEGPLQVLQDGSHALQLLFQVFLYWLALQEVAQEMLEVLVMQQKVPQMQEVQQGVRVTALYLQDWQLSCTGHTQHLPDTGLAQKPLGQIAQHILRRRQGVAEEEMQEVQFSGQGPSQVLQAVLQSMQAWQQSSAQQVLVELPPLQLAAQTELNRQVPLGQQTQVLLTVRRQVGQLATHSLCTRSSVPRSDGQVDTQEVRSRMRLPKQEVQASLAPLQVLQLSATLQARQLKPDVQVTLGQTAQQTPLQKYLRLLLETQPTQLVGVPTHWAQAPWHNSQVWEKVLAQVPEGQRVVQVELRGLQYCPLVQEAEQSEPQLLAMQLQTPPVQKPFWLHHPVQVFLERVQQSVQEGQVRDPKRALMVLEAPYSSVRQVIEQDPIVKTMPVVEQTQGQQRLSSVLSMETVPSVLATQKEEGLYTSYVQGWQPGSELAESTQLKQDPKMPQPSDIMLVCAVQTPFPRKVDSQQLLLAELLASQNSEKVVELQQASQTKEQPLLQPQFVVSANVSSAQYHPVSFSSANVTPKIPFAAPNAVAVINQSQIAVLYQCDPAPAPVPSSFSRGMPSSVLQPKWERAQALTLGVARKLVQGRLAWTYVEGLMKMVQLQGEPVSMSRQEVQRVESKPRMCMTSWRVVAVTDWKSRLVREGAVSTRLQVLKMILPTMGRPACRVLSTAAPATQWQDFPVAPYALLLSVTYCAKMYSSALEMEVPLLEGQKSTHQSGMVMEASCAARRRVWQNCCVTSNDWRMKLSLV